jgi:hypothetical protein
MAEYRLDEATKKALLGLMPFSQGGTMDFTPEAFKDVPKNAQPVFKLRSFTRQEFQDVRDIYSNEEKDKQKALWEIARKTLKGWSKVFDLSTGEAVLFKADADGGVDKELWEALPLLIRRVIFTQVSVMSGLLEQERQGLKS